MRENLRRNATPSRPATSEPPPKGEVGRILLGERLFLIVPAAGCHGRPDLEACCRFDIGGVSLAAIEIGDRRCGLNDLTSRLTGREREIAVLVAQGHATKSIAYRLQISEWTVSTYLRRIFAKLNVESRAAMVYQCASLIDASLAAALEKQDS